jgi:hypothetical protein
MTAAAAAWQQLGAVVGLLWRVPSANRAPPGPCLSRLAVPTSVVHRVGIDRLAGRVRERPGSMSATPTMISAGAARDRHAAR